MAMDLPVGSAVLRGFAPRPGLPHGHVAPVSWKPWTPTTQPQAPSSWPQGRLPCWVVGGLSPAPAARARAPAASRAPSALSCSPVPSPSLEKCQASQEGAVGEQADPRALDERANGPRQALKPAAGETSTHVTPAPTATSPSVRACPSGHCPQNLMVRLWLLTWGPQVEANSKTPPGMPGSEGLRGPGICLHAQAGETGLDEHRLCPCPLHQWEGQADSPRAM